MPGVFVIPETPPKGHTVPPIDTIDLAYGIPLIIVVPAIVQIAKHNGLPSRLAGPAAILTSTVLIALGDVALAASDSTVGQQLASWLIGGIVYGLAAAGFYSLNPAPAGGILPSDDAPPANQHGADHEPRDNSPARSAGSGG